eukprot:m.823 g.823  ORF g.823 m.823 type:complete len:1297 (+) comp4956_c0_seq1:53-3943(+)
MASQFPSFEKQSLTGKGKPKKGKGQLDFDLDFLLEDKSERPKSKSSGKLKTKQQTTKQLRVSGSQRTAGKKSSKTNDEDFYASLEAEIKDENDEEEVVITEEDAKRIASDMADMDDLDSNLFASSLGKKRGKQKRGPLTQPAVPVTSQKKAQLGVSEAKPRKEEKEEKSPVKPKKSTDFDFDDDILADILAMSDEDDDRAFRSKRKRKDIAKDKKDFSVKKQAPLHETEEIKSIDDAPGSLLSRMSPKLRRAALGEDRGGDRAPENADTGVSSGVLVEAEEPKLPVKAPKKKEKEPEVDNGSEDDFDADDMLGDLGFDSPEKGNKIGNMFAKGSRFDELLGKKEPEAKKIERPPTRGKRELEPSNSKGKTVRKTDVGQEREDDFQFGGYVPSVGKDRSEGFGRPSTAPSGNSRRAKSVRFADDLSDDVEEKKGIERPFSSPSAVTQEKGDGAGEKSGRRQDRFQDPDWLGVGGEELPGKKKGKHREASKEKADWLGLGDEVSLDDPLNMTDLRETNVLTLHDDGGEDVDVPSRETNLPPKKSEDTSRPKRSPSDVDTIATMADRPDNDLFGDDFGLGFSRPTSRRRKDEPKQSLFPWESATPDVRSRRSQQQEVASTADETPFRQPSTSTNVPVMDSQFHGRVNRQEGSVAPLPLTSLRPTDLTDVQSSGLAVSLSRAEASAVAMANAAAEGRESVLREEIEKLRAEAKAHKERIRELEEKCTGHEKRETAWDDERQVLKQQVESERDEKTQQKRDSNEKEKELLSKIHVGGVEKGQLESLMQAAVERHQKELENMEAVHKSRIQTMEDSFHRQEARLREELERQASQHNASLIDLEQAKSSVIALYEKKMADLDQEHLESIERLKEVHKSLIDELKKDCEKEKRRQEKLHRQELAAVSQAHSHTRSLQELIAHVKESTQNVSEMQQRVDMAHSVGIQGREQGLKIREEQLKSQEDRLTRQQMDSEQERARLHGLVAKMEARLREQTRQIEQERWKLQQDETRVQALQRALDEDRVTSAEQIATEREELQRAKGKLLQEQQTVLRQCYAERRELAQERTQLSISQKMKHQHELERSSQAIESEAELKVELVSVKRQAEELAEKRQQVKEMEERLKRQKQEVDSERQALGEEKDSIQKMRNKLRRAAEEVSRLEELTDESREEGRQALHEARLIKSDTVHKVQEVFAKKAELQSLEKRLAQERIDLVRQRKDLDRLKDRQFSEKHPFVQTLSMASTYAGTKAAPFTAPVASAHSEYSHALRLWAEEAEKELEELEEENRFLQSLRIADSGEPSSLLP